MNLGFRNALPFWTSLSLPIMAWVGVFLGGGWIWGVPLIIWMGFPLLDAVFGKDTRNPDTNTKNSALTWHRLITLIWAPVQFTTVFGIIAYLPMANHLGLGDTLVMVFSLGLISGSIGIVYAHELMHQPTKVERWLADTLMAMAIYGHFRSEHLLVHHRYVCTPRDPVTARYNEGFHRFFPRVLIQCLKSAWRAEKALLARKKLGPFHRSNPFWRYAMLQLGFLILAGYLGGWLGVAIFLGQAFVAIWELELVNYIEHYGLTRKHLGDGKYEHQKPHHSWNADHRATNWLLINLQRHSDHHYRPDRRFPLLQTYGQDEAPQLPLGYPIMGALALIPPLWRRRMNPRVRQWRKKFYPEITDWTAYNKAENPLPK